MWSVGRSSFIKFLISSLMSLNFDMRSTWESSHKPAVSHTTLTKRYTSTVNVVIYTVMQWRLGAARCIQALIFLFSHRLDASRHFLANFLVIFDHIRHLSFTECFGGKGVALDYNNDLQTLSNFSFFSFIRYLTLGHVSQTLYHQCSQRIKPRYFLIYHYITASIHSIRKLICII